MPAPVIVTKDVGGSVADYQSYRASEREVRLYERRSACTMAIGLPNVCVYPGSTLKFHLAYDPRNHQTNPEVSQQLFDSYPAAVRARLGTLTRNYKVLSGSELIKLRIRDCNEPKTNEPRILVASAAAGKPPLAAQPGAEEPILAGLIDKILSVFGLGKAAGVMHNRVAVSSRPARNSLKDRCCRRRGRLNSRRRPAPSRSTCQASWLANRRSPRPRKPFRCRRAGYQLPRYLPCIGSLGPPCQESLPARSAFFRQASVPMPTWAASAIGSNGLGGTLQGLGMPRPVSRPRDLLCLDDHVTRGSSRSGSCRRRHEFWTDWIGDLLPQDPIDLRFDGSIKRPTEDLADRLQLSGVACSPQRRSDSLVEHPADRQMDDALAEPFLREPIEPLHGGKISTEPGLLEFGIRAAQVVAVEYRIRLHPPGQ
jgi:hypothetical protein